ncbi:hypothetical protein [Micromonospora sp. CPCC 205556]|uniref:hypothetical protein n=1 Tax=Micromonospora sp. CPCC 205556 TaxID=3122398 RepID=UPI002FF4336D
MRRHLGVRIVCRNGVGPHLLDRVGHALQPSDQTMYAAPECLVLFAAAAPVLVGKVTPQRLLVPGMALLVLGGRGGIRLLADHDNAGILHRVPGGFAVQLGCFALMTLIGAGIAALGWREGRRRPMTTGAVRSSVVHWVPAAKRRPRGQPRADVHSRSAEAAGSTATTKGCGRGR